MCGLTFCFSSVLFLDSLLSVKKNLGWGNIFAVSIAKGGLASLVYDWAIESLHEVKSCYALNLSDIAIKASYEWPPLPQIDGKN